MKFHIIATTLLLICGISCKKQKTTIPKTSQEKIPVLSNKKKTPFVWEGANVYFLLTDRFHNGDTTNDIMLNRTKKTAKLRGFEGGDIKGITQKIEEGYFEKLGINAIWFTPVMEQIHDATDEGTGLTYGYHGYWTKDWTSIDPNFGTYKDLKTLIKTAHDKGIRILLDVVLNHTGPVTPKDSEWPKDWVRTTPNCIYKNYETAVSCTLVQNLPDIKSESNTEVALPDFLISKWKKEGRFEKEISELNTFFSETGLQKYPKNYIIKWLTDYVRELGVDGFRIDTVKHVEESVWSTLAEQAKKAFKEWKSKHPEEVLDDNDFYILGELYGYGISQKLHYDFGDKKVNYFHNGFDNLINFQFKYDAENMNLDSLFTTYNTTIKKDLGGKTIMNYIASHDDGSPYDRERKDPYTAATKLLLSPGVSQIYYGDEIARSLIIDSTTGDASLRSNMPWKSLQHEETKSILSHWQKLGSFRKNHPAIGAGNHTTISKTPLVFSRIYDKKGINDKVIIGLNLPKGEKRIKIDEIFEKETDLKDTYSGQIVKTDGKFAIFNTPDTILLIEKN